MRDTLVLLALCTLLGCSSSRERTASDSGTDAPFILEDGCICDAGLPDAPPVDVPPPPDAGPLTCVEATAPASECDTAVCGNGVVDTCTRCYPCLPPGPPWADGGPGECCDTVSEACDGVVPAGTTCATLGYAGGELHCGAWCGLDPKDCDGCGSDARIERCVPAPVDSTVPYALGLAATGEMVGLAWITSSSLDGAAERRVHFARFDSNLSLVSEPGCFAVAEPTFVSVAAVPSGWLLAVGGAGGVHVIPLAPDGYPRGPGRVIPGGGTPHLAERPGAGPLVSYAVAGSIDAQLLREDGTAEWTARVFSGSPTEPDLANAVFTGDGFLVVQRMAGVTVARVELDGTVSGTSMPGGSSTETPQLAWNGTEARVTWTDFSATGTVYFARLDRNGARIAAPVVLGTIPAYFNRSPMVAFGQETLVVMSGYSGGVDLATRLDITKVDRDGRTVVPTFALTQDPTGARGYRAARLGARMVVAWVGGGNGTPHFGPGQLFPGRISLATVRP